MLLNEVSTVLPITRLTLNKKGNQSRKCKLQAQAQLLSLRGPASNFFINKTSEGSSLAKGCRLSHRHKHVLAVQDGSSEPQVGTSSVGKNEALSEVQELASSLPAVAEVSSAADAQPSESPDVPSPAGTSGRAETEGVAAASIGNPQTWKVDAALIAISLWLTRGLTAARDAFMKFWGMLRNVKLKKLEDAAKEDPQNPERFAAWLSELNKSNPAAVLAAVNAKKEAVNSSVVVEYIQALVRTREIERFRTESPTAAGESHRSMVQLLEELKARAAGAAAQPSAGEAISRPLHVVLQEPVKPWGAQLLSLVSGTLAMGFSVLMLSVVWLLGASAIRRHTGGLSSTVLVPAPAATASTVAGPRSPTFSPKEYNKDALPEKSVKSFKDVKGCEESLAELVEVVEFLKNPAKFTKLGAKLPKGVLLTGPPGTGKTLLARAVAGEAGVPFFFRSGSEFEEMYVGVGSKRVRSLFAAAKAKAPCIVFIDEIDAIGGKRQTWEGGNSRKTLNQLLDAMDGFEANEGVIVMAATNLGKTLDPALLRPGRFDRHVAVPLPDVRGRLDILKYYMADKPMNADVDPEIFARLTPGFSGAELANLVNEAALTAAKEGKESITSAMIQDARDKALMGAERKSLVQSAEARKLTAYHESGHALVALHTKGSMPIHKATIMPRGHALGMVSQVPSKDEYSRSKRQMLATIDVCMGGKIAEEIIFGEDMVTSGATSDLKQATSTARHMVADCGMSDAIGPVYVASNAGPYREASEDSQQRVEAEVRTMLMDAYQRVKTLLQDREADLHRLAAALLERETLTEAEIREVLSYSLQGPPIAPAIDPGSVDGLVPENPEPAEDIHPRTSTPSGRDSA